MPIANGSGLKICSHCKIEKNITEFNKDFHQRDGLQWLCRECQHEYRLKYVATRREYDRKYRAEHREASRASCRKYRNAHLAERRESSRLCVQRIRKERPQVVHVQARQSLLFTKYGMTMADYDRMFAEQNGVCAACGKEQTHSRVHNGYLCVDHDHTTGKTRGLLCRKCNIALGHVDDDVEILKKLIEYIQRGRVKANTEEAKEVLVGEVPC